MQTLKPAWSRLLRFGFRLLYNEMAWTYDAVSWAVSLGQWRAWQRVVLPFVRGPRVLELAHGPGHLLPELAEAGYQVVGVDLSPTMGRLARRRLSRERVDAWLVRGRAEALPFARHSFDTILTTFPTAFVFEPSTLRAVQRALKPDGRFLVVPEAHLTGRAPQHRLIAWLFRATGQRYDVFAVDEDDTWPGNPVLRQRLEAVFGETGLMIEIQPVDLDSSVATLLIGRRLA